MNTVIVEIKNRKAYKMLENMETLGAIKLLKPTSDVLDEFNADNSMDRLTRLQKIRAITKDICIDLSNFKFDRNAANDYD